MNRDRPRGGFVTQLHTTFERLLHHLILVKKLRNGHLTWVR